MQTNKTKNCHQNESREEHRWENQGKHKVRNIAKVKISFKILGQVADWVFISFFKVLICVEFFIRV